MRATNMKRSLSFAIRIRRALSMAVTMAVVAVALGWGTHLFTQSSFVNAAKAEERLSAAFRSRSAADSQPAHSDEGPYRAVATVPLSAKDGPSF